jgi:hypothetical protein
MIRAFVLVYGFHTKSTEHEIPLTYLGHGVDSEFEIHRGATHDDSVVKSDSTYLLSP